MTRPAPRAFNWREALCGLSLFVLLLLTAAAWNTALYASLTATVFGDSQVPTLWLLLAGLVTWGLSIALLVYGPFGPKRRTDS